MRFQGWFGALGLGLILVGPVAAQESTFGIGVGRSVGGSAFFGRYVGDAALDGGVGASAWQMQTFSEWSLAARPMTFRVEGLYSQVRVSSTDHWFATVGPVLTPPPGARGFRPYAIAGGALFLGTGAGGSTSVPQAPAHQWAWVPGVNLGAGLAFDLGSLRPGVEVRRYESVLEDAGNGWLSVSLVMRFP